MTCDLIIPALNEAANIRPLFDALDAVRRAVNSESNGKGVRHLFLRRIIVADNGSEDGTPILALHRGAVVVHEEERGYGAACLRAIQWIAHESPHEPPDVVAFLDADLSDDPAQLPRLLEPIARGEAELVIGSRPRKAEPGALNFVQRFGNSFACLLMRATSGRRYTDLGPFRAIRWDTLKKLKMADRTWGWTVEMQMKAAIMGVPTTEVDVPYRRRRGGKSKISGTIRGVARAGTKILLTIARLWWQAKRLSLS